MTGADTEDGSRRQSFCEESQQPVSRLDAKPVSVIFSYCHVTFPFRRRCLGLYELVSPSPAPAPKPAPAAAPALKQKAKSK